MVDSSLFRVTLRDVAMSENRSSLFKDSSEVTFVRQMSLPGGAVHPEILKPSDRRLPP